jgi:hypothetical protein
MSSVIPGAVANELSVVFPSGDNRVPVAAYCFVRVLPLYGHGFENAPLVE